MMVCLAGRSDRTSSGLLPEPPRSEGPYLVGTNGRTTSTLADRWQAMLIPFFDRYVKGKKRRLRRSRTSACGLTQTPDGSSTKWQPRSRPPELS